MFSGLKQPQPEAPQKTGFFPFSNDKDKEKEKEPLQESKEKEKPKENFLKLFPASTEDDKKPVAEAKKPFELFSNNNNISKSIISNENSSLKDKAQESTPNAEKNVGLFSNIGSMDKNSPIDMNSSGSKPSNTDAKITPFSNGLSQPSGTNSLFNNSQTPGAGGLFLGFGNTNNPPKENTTIAPVINKEEPNPQNSLFAMGNANNNISNANKTTNSIFGNVVPGGIFGNAAANNQNEGSKMVGLFGATPGNKGNIETSTLFGASKPVGLFGNLVPPKKES